LNYIEEDVHIVASCDVSLQPPKHRRMDHKILANKDHIVEIDVVVEIFAKPLDSSKISDDSGGCNNSEVC